jgi:hypothetical protein
MQVKVLPILLLSLCSYGLYSYGAEKCTPNKGNHCNADGTCEIGYTLSPGTKIVSCIPTEVAPEIRPYSAIISPNTKLIISVEDLTSGVGNNRLTDKYLVVSATPTSETHGKVTHTDEKITYVPDQNYHGKAKFNFKLKNDKDEVSNESTISVLISDISEPPSAGLYSTETKENTDLKITIDEMKSVIGAADPNDTFTFDSVRLTKESHGTVAKEKKYLIYTPDEDFHGGASFNYVIKDAAGQVSNQAAINVNVTAVNQNSVADVYTTKTNKNTVLIIHVADLSPEIRIGDKKYEGKEYFVPKASKFHNYSNDRSQDEFMLTHRSYNRNNVAFESNKIDKQCKIIDQIINFFLSDSKKSGKTIN